MNIVGTILIGSQNYKLDTPESDRDYKVIATPSFKELYDKTNLNKGSAPAPFFDTDKEHYTTLDIRTFAKGLERGNPNHIEMLFSTEIEDEYKPFHDLLEKWREPYRHGYVAAGWQYFTTAIKGMLFNGFKAKGITAKTMSRYYYFFRLVRYIALHDFQIDETILRHPTVCDTAREKRLNGDWPISTTVEQLLHNYDEMVSGLEVPEFVEEESDLFIPAAQEFVYKEMGGLQV